jgi:transposase-like protein
MNCIHCQSEAIVKNGTKTLKTGQVLQQYLCNTCGRRFNERSGTPMARLRAPVATVEMALNPATKGWASELPPESWAPPPAILRPGKSA